MRKFHDNLGIWIQRTKYVTSVYISLQKKLTWVSLVFDHDLCNSNDLCQGLKRDEKCYSWSFEVKRKILVICKWVFYDHDWFMFCLVPQNLQISGYGSKGYHKTT